MCYNCGCQMPDNDMGDPHNITNKTFNEASKAAGRSAEEAKKNTLDLLQKNAWRRTSIPSVEKVTGPH
jgi:hypothetical protein